MPRILTTRAIITCPHGGVGTTIPSWPFWNIEGGQAVRQGDAGTLTCVFPYPCTGYVLRSMGLNATKIDGLPAILETDFNQSLTGLPLTMTDTHNVIDNSTPAPVPIGGAPAPQAAELLDFAAPVVVAVPPAAAFNSVTQLPVTVPISFSLSSAFPLQWILTRVSEPPNAGHQDLTNGLPPGAVAVPSGGSWTTPSLSVTLTLNAAYMTSLGVGVHHFYMTGVSRRGLSAYAECVLTVS